MKRSTSDIGWDSPSGACFRHATVSMFAWSVFFFHRMVPHNTQYYNISNIKAAEQAQPRILWLSSLWNDTIKLECRLTPCKKRSWCHVGMWLLASYGLDWCNGNRLWESGKLFHGWRTSMRDGNSWHWIYSRYSMDSHTSLQVRSLSLSGTPKGDSVWCRGCFLVDKMAASVSLNSQGGKFWLLIVHIHQIAVLEKLPPGDSVLYLLTYSLIVCNTLSW